MNGGIPLPAIPLRIGLVTSCDARGMTDFLHVLQASGYAFEVVHVHAAVQGAEMEGEVCSALELLARHQTRGGSTPSASSAGAATPATSAGGTTTRSAPPSPGCRCR
jgi:hypothetical protein